MGLDKPNKKNYPPQLEDPIVLVTSCMLRSGINSHFPNTKPSTWSDDRFFVHLKDYGSTTYVIIDNDLDIRVELDLSVLENPDFDLIKWYLECVMADGLFYEKYLAHHMSHYKSGAAESNTQCLNAPMNDASDVLKEVIVMRNIKRVLENCAPFPGDDNAHYPIDPTYHRSGRMRFDLDVVDTPRRKLVVVYDRLQGMETHLSWDLASCHWVNGSLSITP